MKAWSLFFFAIVALTAGGNPMQAQSTATYRLSFQASWSQASHPEAFPSNPHFSGLIGATHGDTETLWEVGSLASAGIQSMAETGAKGTLKSEISQLNSLGTTLDGGGINRSPGAQELTFETSEASSRVSLVSMVAPSPDWFVGVSSLGLRAGGEWLTEVVVNLYAYDAGTDDGMTYQAPNQASTPHVGVARLEEAPFLVDGTVRQVGTFTFSLIQATGSEADVPMTAFGLSVYPNPAIDRATLWVEGAAAPTTRVQLFDMLGRTVYERVEASPSHTGPRGIPLDIPELAAGTYLVYVANGRDQASRLLTILGQRW